MSADSLFYLLKNFKKFIFALAVPEIIAIALIIGIPAIGVIVLSNKISKSAVTSQPSPSLSVEIKPSPPPSPSPDAALGEKTQDSFKSFFDDPSPSSSSVLNTHVQADSSLKIERCKSQAKSKRIESEEKLNREYAQSEPGIVELASTQSNGETEAVALKYGYMTQSQVVRRTEVFEKLLNEGVPYEQAAQVAQAEGDSYSTYLRSLHDWGLNEFNKWKSVLKSEMDKYENDVYNSCLNS